MSAPLPNAVNEENSKREKMDFVQNHLKREKKRKKNLFFRLGSLVCERRNRFLEVWVHTSRKGGRLAAFGERPSHFGAARRSQMDITPLPNVSAAAKCRKRRKLKERKNGLCSESSET